jgi:hypothetical protein
MASENEWGNSLGDLAFKVKRDFGEWKKQISINYVLKHNPSIFVFVNLKPPIIEKKRKRKTGFLKLSKNLML